jgi:Glycosyl hydrolase family 79, N-terminal domain
VWAAGVGSGGQAGGRGQAAACPTGSAPAAAAEIRPPDPRQPFYPRRPPRPPRPMLLLFLSLAGAAAYPVELTVDTSVVRHRIPASYVSFNLDWHLDSEEWPSWKACSIMNMSLTEPNLIFLAKSLAPAVLRVGGSEGDLVIYETPGKPCPANTTFCLTMTRWAEIQTFVAATGLDLAFGLNAMAGRVNASNPNATCHTCSWDPTNTRDFLAYTAENNYKVKYLEFGNELTPKVDMHTYAQDALAVRNIINSLWPGNSRPLLVANDENPDPNYLKTVLSIAGQAIDVATWHLYIG